MVEALASLFLAGGTFFIALSAVGLLRLPDVYSRLHAITKASTLGMFGILIASGCFFLGLGETPIGEVVAIAFIVFTNPVGGHMIARSAYLIGVRLSDRSVIDELARAGERAATVQHDVD